MRKYIYIIFIGIIASGCGQSNQYEIRGSFNGPVDEEWIYLVRFLDNEPQTDSARIENNQFLFRGVVDNVEVYGLSFHYSTNPQIAPILLEPGELEIVIDINDWYMGTVISGGKYNDEYQAFMLAGHDDHFEASVQYIKSNPSSPVSVYLLAFVFSNMEIEELGHILDHFPDKLQQTVVWQEANSYYQTQHTLQERTPSFNYPDYSEEMHVDFGNESILTLPNELVVH